MRSLILAAAFMAAVPIFAATQPAPVKIPTGSPEEVVCHSEAVTGNAARRTRICMTRAQWRAQSEATQAESQRMEDHGFINSCHNGDPSKC